MNISLSRRMKVNLGNYESYEFSAQSTVHHGDLGYTDQEIQEGSKKGGKAFRDKVFAEMRDEAEERLDQLLIADIETSREITEEDRSVVLRAFTSRGSDTPTSRERSAPTRRPRRAR